MHPPKRRSFNDAASRDGDPPPPAPSHICSAHGCPLAGSIKVDGQWICFVHLAIREPRLWDGATARIRNRMAYVSALEVLRAPGFRTDAMALAQAREYVPMLSPEHDTRYKALAAIENRLVALAQGGDPTDDDPGPPPNVVVDATQRFVQSHRIPA